MPICVFPPHYQLVYINLNISSFSAISYERQRKNSGATFGKNTDRNFSVLGSCFRMSELRVLLQRGDGESLTRRVVSVLSERVIHEGL